MRVFILLFLFSSLTHAFDFKLKGNSKTSEDVVRIEIKDLLEQDLDDQVLNELKRRLWNLRVFSSVKVEKVSETQILIQVEERWTTIPIAKFQGGGGSTYFTLGAYDINTFGANTEIGAQYESLNNRPAGVLWLRKPQFLYDRNLKFGVDVWDINRIRYLFKRNGEDDGAYTLQRKKINLFTEKKWKNDQYLFGVQLEYHDDRVSDFGLTDEQIELNQLNGFSPDSDSISLWHSVYFHWGRLNYQNYLVSGVQLQLKSSLVSLRQKEENFFGDHSFRFVFYKLFKNNHNFAFQFLVSGNNLKNSQYLNYIGGLSEVRGYRDGQFYDQTFYQSNIEHRFDLYHHSWGVIQAVVFTDQAKEAQTLAKITESKDEILLSSGIGLRFISPKIFRFVGRLDYAQTHTRFVDQNISFGIQ